MADHLNHRDNYKQLPLNEANILLGSKFRKNSVDASKAIFKKIETATNVVVVTDGPNVACGVNKEQIVKVKPSMIEGNVSRGLFARYA